MQMLPPKVSRCIISDFTYKVSSFYSSSVADNACAVRFQVSVVIGIPIITDFNDTDPQRRPAGFGPTFIRDINQTVMLPVIGGVTR